MRDGPGEEPAPERGGRDRGGEEEHRATPAAREEAHGAADARRPLERGRELGRSSGGDEEVVDAAETLALVRGQVLAEELVEVGRTARHSSSPSSRSARRCRPLRVRVFTVPSGTFR